jgi:GT2 family glycosyltransferase
VLYHWRKARGSTAIDHQGKPRAAEAARRAVQSYLDARGRGGVAEPGPAKGLQRVRYPIQWRPKVSVVLPTAGKAAELHGRRTWYVSNCVESIRRRSTYDRLEILVVDNDDLAPDLQRELDRLGVVRVPFTDEFNLAAKINLGAAKADGDYLLFLNDDMEVISPDWVERMLEHGQWPEVGAVGAKLYFGDGRLQHCGVTFLQGVLPSHHFYRERGDHPGYWAGNMLVRNYSAVTGACLLTRTDLFHELGGWDLAVPLNFTDMDYCMRLTERGYRIVFQPDAELHHFESVSKEGCFQHELDRFVRRWGHRWKVDPLYSPHLTQREGDFRIGTPGQP